MRKETESTNTALEIVKKARAEVTTLNGVTWTFLYNVSKHIEDAHKQDFDAYFRETKVSKDLVNDPLLAEILTV